MAKLEERHATLTLGWQVTPELEPTFWLKDNPVPGRQAAQDLVEVPADSLGCHMAIIAQSGYGKSFFLGRLIEELLLSTKARCIILDPNADFRRITEVVEDKRWESPKYDRKKATGSLPSESKRDDFEGPWSKIDKRLLVGPEPGLGESLNDGWGERWKLPLQSLSFELLADNADRSILTDLYHCHEFIIELSHLLALQHQINGPPQMSIEADHRWNVDEKAREIFDVVKPLDVERRLNFIESRFFPGLSPQSLDLSTPFLSYNRAFDADDIKNLFVECANHIEYISKPAAHYYFGRVAAEVHKDIIEPNIAKIAVNRQRSPARLNVVDLSSFPDPGARFLATDSVLVQIWERARREWEFATASNVNDTRVPTYVVVDEAHNLMPAECESLPARTIRNHFQRIAAEGRKYGIFLIICSQRPEKLDPTVVSECENVAIMKLGSRSVLDASAKLFGLEDLEKFGIRRCLEFLPGRALLCGKWAKTPQTLFTAMRRTEEGGKNLRPEYWAVPYVGGEEPIVPSSDGANAHDISTLDQDDAKKRDATISPQRVT